MVASVEYVYYENQMNDLSSALIDMEKEQKDFNPIVNDFPEYDHFNGKGFYYKTVDLSNNKSLHYEYLIEKYEGQFELDDINDILNIEEIYLINKVGYINFAIKCLIIWFIQILYYFEIDFDHIEIKTKNNNYIYKNTKTSNVEDNIIKIEDKNKYYNYSSTDNNNFKQYNLSSLNFNNDKKYDINNNSSSTINKNNSNNLGYNIKDDNINDKIEEKQKEETDNLKNIVNGLNEKYKDKNYSEEHLYDNNECINSIDKNKKTKRKNTKKDDGEIINDIKNKLNNYNKQKYVNEKILLNRDSIKMFGKIYNYINKIDNEDIEKNLLIKLEKNKSRVKKLSHFCNILYKNDTIINSDIYIPVYTFQELKEKYFSEIVEYIENLIKNTGCIQK